MAVLGGGFIGCGSLFSWNGRHAVAIHPVTPGVPLRGTFQAVADRRYTLAVQVVFEREGLPVKEGDVVVEAKMPLAAWLDDSSGVAVVKEVGWLDPAEPRTVVYGHGAAANRRRPRGAPPPELVAERLIGPHTARTDRAIGFAVDLGSDQLETTRIQGCRAVIYDDAMPRSITLAFAAAGLGFAVFLTGAFAFAATFFRSRRGGVRRRQTV